MGFYDLWSRGNRVAKYIMSYLETDLPLVEQIRTQSEQFGHNKEPSFARSIWKLLFTGLLDASIFFEKHISQLQLK